VNGGQVEVGSSIHSAPESGISNVGLMTGVASKLTIDGERNIDANQREWHVMETDDTFKYQSLLSVPSPLLGLNVLAPILCMSHPRPAQSPPIVLLQCFICFPMVSLLTAHASSSIRGSAVYGICCITLYWRYTLNRNFGREDCSVTFRLHRIESNGSLSKT
jgi:hypothetical protein